MSGLNVEISQREFDAVITRISDYVINYTVESELAYDTAHLCLIDSMGCALMALDHPQCTRLLGPIIPGTIVPHGASVPATTFQLDPVQAAFTFGTMVRWLDFNDTWLAKEWGHPSDNLGAILMLADHLSRVRLARGEAAITIKDVLTMMIKAHEIQGVLALENSFNLVGLDHVLLVKVASTAVACALLGATNDQMNNALSHAWIDGQSLRTYRHAPNTGSRKSWAAGDATARGVRLAMISMLGEMGYPSALTVPMWGFNDVSFRGNAVQLQQPLGTYVMENILFKISYPAEFHAQTAVEAAIQLHSIYIASGLKSLNNIVRIGIQTHESAMRIINKNGALNNYADRDHCLQYMVACGLIFGELTVNSYSDQYAADFRIDSLREKMHVFENAGFTKDYLDPSMRSIANAVTLHFDDGTQSDIVLVEYPLGHRRRRAEGIPILLKKFEDACANAWDSQRANRLMDAVSKRSVLESLTVPEFIELFSV